MEEKIWEQPSIEDNVQVADAKVEEGTTCLNEGSHLGKFKDADSLLSAYNNLQAEFTKKCQKLSEIEKGTQQESMPIYLNEKWHDKLGEFLENNQDAKTYAKEISNILIEDKSIAEKDDALSMAWAKVMQKHYKAPDKILADETFVENYILKDDNLRSKLLANYIKDLENKKIPPLVASSGGNIYNGKVENTTTLDEAKKLVEKIFNKGD